MDGWNVYSSPERADVPPARAILRGAFRWPHVFRWRQWNPTPCTWCLRPGQRPGFQEMAPRRIARADGNVYSSPERAPTPMERCYVVPTIGLKPKATAHDFGGTQGSGRLDGRGRRKDVRGELP